MPGVGQASGWEWDWFMAVLGLVFGIRVRIQVRNRVIGLKNRRPGWWVCD